MSTRIPHLLAPYLPLRESSLTLVTSVFGAPANWVLLRYLIFLLARPTARDDEHHVPADGESDEGGEKAVMLVSFMRDYTFFKDGAARLGLDLDVATRQGTFTFVDGLTGLFVPPIPGEKPVKGRRVLRSPKVEDMQKELEAAVEEARRAAGGRKVVLIMDQPDVFMATTSSSTTSLALTDMILSLREKVYAAVLNIQADEPLIDTKTTTLERAHANLALSAAHEADLVLSLRELDTGAAKDVSGVLRITGGGAREGVEACEYLYLVGGDEGVKVFERGQ